MRIAVAVFALLSLAVSSASAFQVNPEPEPRYEDFSKEPDVVTADVHDPALEKVDVRVPERLRSLVEIREDFDAELVDSAHSL
jgi:hypothetical protein